MILKPMNNSKTITDENAAAAASTDRWLGARERVRRGEARDIRSALLDNIIDGIRDAEIVDAPIVAPLKGALTAEKHARKELDRAEQARKDAVAIQLEWEQMMHAVDNFQEQIKIATDRIAAARDFLADGEEFVVLAVSNPNESRSVLDAACVVASTRLAIPIMERGLEKPRNELKAHVRTMREFEKKNGVPKEILASLPND
jgi:hypothetical protein